MGMPGFTAEVSLAGAHGRFGTGLPWVPNGDASVIPATYFCPVGCIPIWYRRCFEDPVLHQYYCFKTQGCLCHIEPFE
jgi:hypothetical protein